MKVLILGGCGVAGNSAACDIIKRLEVTKVTLADKTIDMNKVDVTLRKSPKVTTQIIDVSDFEALVKAMKDNDVIINCVGPFFKFGLAPMKAAIEAGKNYVDICDDSDVTKEAFTLHESAKAAGVSICLGCGAGPGQTNIIAKYGADKLDEVDEIRILLAAGLGDEFGPAVLPHIFHGLMGDVPQFIDGNLQVPGDSGREEVEFLEPIGKCEVFYFGHPEPVTLSRYIRGVKTVVLKLGNLPPWLNEWCEKCCKINLASLQPIRVGDNSIVPRDFLASILRDSAFLEKEAEGYRESALCVVVKGREGDKGVTYTYHAMPKMPESIGVTASMVAQMLYRGEVKTKGVLAPEGFIDAKSFLSDWKTRGMRLYETKTVTQEV